MRGAGGDQAGELTVGVVHVRLKVLLVLVRPLAAWRQPEGAGQRVGGPLGDGGLRACFHAAQRNALRGEREFAVLGPALG